MDFDKILDAAGIREKVKLVTAYLATTSTTILKTYEDSKLVATYGVPANNDVNVYVKLVSGSGVSSSGSSGSGVPTTKTLVFQSNTTSTTAFRAGKWTQYLDDLVEDALDVQAAQGSTGNSFDPISDGSTFPTYSIGPSQYRATPVDLKKATDVIDDSATFPEKKK